MKETTKRLELFGPYYFATLGVRLNAMKQRGIDVIRLDIGSPDMPPEPSIVKALSDAASQSHTHRYQPHQGTPALRQAWADMYQRVYGVQLDPQEEILPLIGSKEGIFHLTEAFIDPGDAVLVPNPGYVTYCRSALFNFGEIFDMPLDQGNAYLPDLDSVPVSVLDKVKLMWLNYPNNPTAAVAPWEFLVQAVAFARRHDLLLCHDAAYTQVTFDGYHAPSILEIPGAKDVAVEFNTLSKSHNMAGWRLGVLVGNAQAVTAVCTIKTNVDSGHFLPIHIAAIQAMGLDQSWIDQRNEVYRQRRDLVVSALHKAGLAAEQPRASLYVWCPVPPGWKSIDFVDKLLDDAHVSVTPGTFFGSKGEGFVRISLTEPLEMLDEAMQRLTHLLDKVG